MVQVMWKYVNRSGDMPVLILINMSTPSIDNLHPYLLSYYCPSVVPEHDTYLISNRGNKVDSEIESHYTCTSTGLFANVPCYPWRQRCHTNAYIQF